MGQIAEKEGLVVGAKLRGMRICLAHIREEALGYGQVEVAEYLGWACDALDCEIDLLDGEI
jgi:hypothetical protein